jgi:hypothetical protein
MVFVPQGYYRRADALYALGKVKLAYADFKRAAKVAPKDPDLRKKLLECEKEVKKIRFEEALALPVSFSLVLDLLLFLISMEKTFHCLSAPEYTFDLSIQYYCQSLSSNFISKGKKLFAACRLQKRNEIKKIAFYSKLPHQICPYSS